MIQLGLALALALAWTWPWTDGRRRPRHHIQTTSHHITPHHITPTPSFRITLSDEEQEEIVFLQLTSIAFKGRAFSIEAELKMVGSAFVCLLFLSFYLPNLRSCMLMTPQKHFSSHLYFHHQTKVALESGKQYLVQGSYSWSRA